LQDIVNEIGKRLGYEVQNGRYQGVVNQSGFDGLWFDGTNHIFAFQRRFRLDIRSGILAAVGRFAGGERLDIFPRPSPP
jgi:hypothetical protein